MSEVLDLPRIDAALIDKPAAPRTDVAVASAAALDLARVDIHAVVRAQFAAGRAEAETALKELGSTVLDLSNQSKITEAKSLRERRVNVPIADMRKLGKGQRSALSQAGKTSSAEEEAVVGIFAKAGEALTTQIDAAQKKIDDEKEAKRQAENVRLSGLRDTVDGIMAKWLERCNAEGMTAERIGAGIEALRELAMPPELADVQAHWKTSHAATIDAMGYLQRQAATREETARLEAQRLENERIAAEQRAQAEALAAQQRALAEQAAALARQQAEIEAARQRAIAPSKPEPYYPPGDYGDIPGGPDTSGEAATIQRSGDGESGPVLCQQEAAGECNAARGQPGVTPGPLHPNTTSGAAPQHASEPVNPEADAAPGGTEGAPGCGDCNCLAQCGDVAAHAADIATRDWTAVAFTGDASIETSEREARPYTPRVILVDEPAPDPIDALLLDCLELTKYAAAPFMTRFPTQPKPAPEWWAGLRERIERLQPLLKALAGEDC